MKTNKDIAQEEIINSLPIPCHGLLKLAPRVGKTKICLTLLGKQSPKSILWVTPSTELRDKDIPEQYETWGYKDLLAISTIVCYKSLHNVKGHYDVVILDEYQDVTENNTSGFFNGNITYGNIIGLSGTHPRDFDKGVILNNLGLTILADISIEDAIEKSLIADYTINVLFCETNNTDKNIEAGNKVKTWMQTERQTYTYLSNNITRPFFPIKRMRFIYNSPTKEAVAVKLLETLKGGRNLVFCSSIDQAERLGNGNTYHSKTNDIQLHKFINKEINELYCVNAGSVGFTYEGIDNLVIIQTNSDNKGDTSQKMSRTLLHQNNYKGNIWFICLEDTKDKEWLHSALKYFDDNKINFIQSKTLWNGDK